jgi:uncharacterized protein YktA (UPF0223 family)
MAEQRLEVLVQRKKLEDKYKKFQALVDSEIQNASFTLYSDTQKVLFTSDIFPKQKRQREENVANDGRTNTNCSSSASNV